MRGLRNGGNGNGVRGYATGAGLGVYGESQNSAGVVGRSTSGKGVEGYTQANGQYGVYGKNESSQGGIGVVGYAPNGTGVGVLGQGPGFGVYAKGDLRVDGSTGNLQFFDQRTGELVATLPTVTEGFVQVTMRNLGRLRTTAGHRADAPYRLQRHASGHVVLVDPETGTTISLNAFGPTNAQAFAQLLQGGKS